MERPGRLITYNGNNRCSQEVRYYLILHLGAHQFVGHDPLSLMGAAVIRDDRCTCTVGMVHVTLAVAACSLHAVVAAVFPDRVSGKGGDCLIGAAVETCVMNQGKAEAARQHQHDQEE